MFSQLPIVEAGSARRALAFSLGLHIAVAVYLCWRPEPPLINRSAVMMGDNGSSLGVVYLPTDSSLRLPVNEESHSLKYAQPIRKRVRKPHHMAPHQTDEHPTVARVQPPSTGSANGDSDIAAIYGVGALQP